MAFYEERIRQAYARAGYHSPAHPDSYYVGLDLGQVNDPTALAVLRTPTQVPESGKRHYDLGKLERFELGTPYPKIVAAVGDLIRTLKGRATDVELLIDATGVGKPVVDMFEEKNIDHYAITFTAGHEVTRGQGYWHYNVPKRDLVSAVKVAFQTGRLRVAAGLPTAETFRKELTRFKVKINLKGHDQYEAWRENDHDDLVLATSMAVWAGDNLLRRGEWGPAPGWRR